MPPNKLFWASNILMFLNIEKNIIMLVVCSERHGL